MQLLGTVLGDLALIHLPFGGIYLIGGMARAVTPWIGRSALPRRLPRRAGFPEFMDQFGIAVVEDDYAALTGCASHLRHLPVEMTGRRQFFDAGRTTPLHRPAGLGYPPSARRGGRVVEGARLESV